MRKIISEIELEKSEKKRKNLLGMVLIFILLFSSAGYFISDFSSEKKEVVYYQGIAFTKLETGYWQFSLGKNQYQVLNTPDEIKHIQIEARKAVSDYLNKPVYFEDNFPYIILEEITNNVGGFFERVGYACLESNCSNFPVKNCSSMVLIAKPSEKNKSLIKEDNNCVYIEYAEGEETKSADSLIFRLVGLI
jgi:hypothetical protein